MLCYVWLASFLFCSNYFVGSSLTVLINLNPIDKSVKAQVNEHSIYFRNVSKILLEINDEAFL